MPIPYMLSVTISNVSHEKKLKALLCVYNLLVILFLQINFIKMNSTRRFV